MSERSTEQQTRMSIRFGQAAALAGGVLLTASLLSGCSEQSADVGSHVLTVHLDCNDKTSGFNKVVIDGGHNNTWGANIINTSTGALSLGVGMSESPSGFVAGRVPVSDDETLYGYGPVKIGDSITDYSIQIDLHAGPNSNEATATCVDGVGGIETHFKTPVPVETVP